ncbi:UDP-N-acetylglucosamine 2-epimerase (non-hydrolyzing) [Echinicola strongylocentroti]|uniref:UDP-N-acetylglucosamine 2-epimerase (non-hydrolyzing) n=1 Tax=Echinicola strongylocentroti TaxID=1795355 RepID=A0A2Z4INV0_9BACT|nr:UDP-N-acetylglucosamine 2-epimerase (non-hydrolyzing) [Echinicola strongylocentroti]AWW32226.1 UDP-N-acetylglucosamine 2-epimerase (non-hydrolyzing) [Echinicola strongylocentroti]
MGLIKNLIVFGTRPEAIKMAPLINTFKKRKDEFDTKICVTAQHRQMLDQVLDFFGIEPDYDLNLMKPNQNLFSLTADILTELKVVLEDFRPDFVYVHGDTSTSMVASLASFYFGAKICHIEAGLRTFNKKSPFPEEINRQITGRLADYHFAPTHLAKQNLLKENVDDSKILITGNTVIDALLESVKRVKEIENNEITYLKSILQSECKLILVTGHRRENHGRGFIEICEALKCIAENNEDVQIIYPVHLNPNVKGPVYEILSGIDNIYLIDPLSYPSFVWLMNESYLIITDSGGVQEEAPSLGKPVLVLRDTTERPEAVSVGTVKLVGTDREKIVSESQFLLLNEDKYREMSELHNPYGDGKACARIVEYVSLKTNEDEIKK